LNKLFNLENPFWQAMGNIFDLFVLNVLWLLCCIPIVTIGPSTCAFYYVLIDLVRNEEPPIAKTFFRSFRQNLKQGILLGLLLTAIGVFLGIDIYLCRHSGTGIYTFFMVFFSVIFLFWAFVTLYAFPLLAKFEKSIKEILIWAFSLSIKNAGKTLLMLFAFVIAIWACHILTGLIFIAFGVAAEFQAALLASILSPYLPDNSIIEDEYE
jgi:uncharacterized membrane protein YesL